MQNKLGPVLHAKSGKEPRHVRPYSCHRYIQFPCNLFVAVPRKKASDHLLLPRRQRKLLYKFRPFGLREYFGQCDCHCSAPSIIVISFLKPSEIQRFKVQRNCGTFQKLGDEYDSGRPYLVEGPVKVKACFEPPGDEVAIYATVSSARSCGRTNHLLTLRCPRLATAPAMINPLSTIPTVL